MPRGGVTSQLAFCAACIARTRRSRSSERAHRKIPQPQFRESPLLPDTKQRPIECQPDGLVPLANGDADALAEIPVVDVRPAAKSAAVLRVGSVEPERERNRVAEQ